MVRAKDVKGQKIVVVNMKLIWVFAIFENTNGRLMIVNLRERLIKIIFAKKNLV